METVTINGITYHKRPQKQGGASPRIPPALYTILAAASMMGGYEQKKPTPLQLENDIPTEYELILNKKSKLSRSQREAVINYFKYNYEQL